MRTPARDIVRRARRLTPAPVTRAGRAAYRQAAEATAPLRLRPAFLLIGAQRSGTTSLFNALCAHPQLVPPTFRKGVNYFDLNHHRGPRWYRGHFPLTAIASRRAARHGGEVAFDASGYYMYHPFALARAAHDMPELKLVAMLRDPVERAFSAWKHESARGFEDLTFMAALELEDERLRGEVERMAADPSYESFSHRHHSYRHRGLYAEQLERAFAGFGRDHVLVIDSEDYFADPAAAYGHLLEFLGLRPFVPARFARANARPGPPMDPAARRMLTEYFEGHDTQLAALLGRAPAWNR